MTSQARVCLLSTMWNWLTLSSVEWFIYCLHIFFNNTFFLLYAGFERLILVSILSKLCIWDQWTTLYTPCSVVRLDKLAIFVHSPSFVWDQILFHSWNCAKTSSCSPQVIKHWLTCSNVTFWKHATWPTSNGLSWIKTWFYLICKPSIAAFKSCCFYILLFASLINADITQCSRIDTFPQKS